MKSVTFYRRSMIANRKRTPAKNEQRLEKLKNWFFKTPSRLTEDGITRTGKFFITFYY